MTAAKIEPTALVQRIEGVSVTETFEGMFLMDIQHGYLFKLNQTATAVWELICDPISVRELCRRLVREYGIGESDCLTDVSELLELLREAGLIRMRYAEAHGPVE